MKKIISLVVAMLAGLSLLSAQDLGFSVTCNGQEVTEGCTIEVKGVVDFESTYYLVAYFVLTSTADTDILFNLRFDANSIPEGASVSLCGFGACVSVNSLPNNQTIEPGSVHGENHETDALDITYTPNAALEPCEVEVVMMNKTANKNLSFTIKYLPSKEEPTANEDALAASVKVYPNPARDNVNFRLNNVKAGAKVVLRDLNGRTVRSVFYNNAEVGMNLEGLASGVYFYSVEENGANVVVGKLVVR